jgi:endoglucanase
LQLPASDRHLIVTVHYYLPFPFTHQGASWVQPPQPEGVRWSGNSEEVSAMEKDFQGVIEWAKKNDRPIYVGEFGAFEKADMQSRAKWTKQVRAICEKNGFSWAYWELASGFGVLDRDTKTWKTPLLEALVK